MGQESLKVRRWEGGGRVGLHYWCQGCEELHGVVIQRADHGACWGYNGNPDAPTFTPSVLVTSGHYVAGNEEGGKGCWCRFNAEAIAKGEEPSGFECRRCHTFITDGQVNFLDDCTHELRGVHPLPDLPEQHRDPA